MVIFTFWYFANYLCLALLSIRSYPRGALLARGTLRCDFEVSPSMARLVIAALAASLVLQVSCLNVPSRGALPRMRRAARQPLPVLLTEVKDEELEVWRMREEIMRGVYGAVVNWKEDEREEREERLEEGNESGADAKSAFVASAAAVIVGAFILRLGGRAALVSVLGLDVVADLGLGDQINDVVSYANALGGWAVVGFFAAWAVAKVFLLDVLGIALAFSSGIIFGGVFEGAAISALGATLG